MKKSEINTMNRSFRTLRERRDKIIEDERTIQLQERVKNIRAYSIKNMDLLIEKVVKNFEKSNLKMDELYK